MSSRRGTAHETKRPAALLLALSLCAFGTPALASDPLPRAFDFEVSGFDLRYHDNPSDWLGSLSPLGVHGIENHALTPGALGLDRSWDGTDRASGIFFNGEAGGWQVSVLGIQDRNDESMDLRNRFVALVTRELFEAARIGLMMTSGHSDSGGDARTVGMDVSYRTRGAVEASAWVQQTDNPTPIEGDAHAWGARLRYPGPHHDAEARFAVYGEAFDPALGQVNRRGVEDARLTYRFRPRDAGPGEWQRSHSLEGQSLGAIDGPESSGWLRLGLLDAANSEGDRIEGFVSTHREVLVDGFDLVERLAVDPGDYGFTRYGVNLSTSRFERWVLGLQLARGEYLHGERTDWRVSGEWRASDWLRLDAAYMVNEHRQPAGAFTARTLSVHSELLLLPGLTLAPAVQFNNVNEQLGLKARLRWRTGPGHEVLLDWNRTMLRTLEDRLIAPLQDSVLRGTMKFRF